MVAEPDRLMMSVEDYLTLDRSSVEVRYEYVDGYVYMLAQQPLSRLQLGLEGTPLSEALCIP